MIANQHGATSSRYHGQSAATGGNDHVGSLLNAVIADMFALYVKTKGFHWHVSGPHFRSRHLLFDEQAVQILAAIDPMAERARKVGISTLKSIGDISRRQRIRDNDATEMSAHEMLIELREDNLGLIQSLRELKDAAEDAHDHALSSLVDDWTDEAQGRSWFLLEATRP